MNIATVKEWYLALLSKLLGKEIKTITNRHLLWAAAIFYTFLWSLFVFPKHHERVYLIYESIGYLVIMVPLGVALEFFRKPPS